MNILMASDENYVFLLGTSLYSLFNTNKNIDSLDVYVIADGITPSSMNKLDKMAEKFGRKLIYLAPPEMDTDIVVKGTLNISTYYRLKMTTLLPSSVDKVLYLDCDTLIRGSLSELWDINIENYLLAGVVDTTGKYARLSIELQQEDSYVNAGILLINLDRWRMEKIEEQFLAYLKEKRYSVEFNDQGIINHVCSSKMLLINPKYDFMMPYERYSRKQLLRLTQRVEFYNDIEIEEAKQNPKIVHYAGYAFNRPWFKNAKGKYVKEFISSMKKSGFYVEPKSQPDNYKYHLRSFANSLPDGLSVFVNQTIDAAYRFSEKLKELRKTSC